MSSTQIITHINSFARIVQRRQPAFVTSPKVADPAIKLQQKQIYNSLPKDSVKVSLTRLGTTPTQESSKNAPPWSQNAQTLVHSSQIYCSHERCST